MDDPLSRLVAAHAALERLPDEPLRELLRGVVVDLLGNRDPREGLGLLGGEFAALARAHRDHHLRTAAALLGIRKRWKRSALLARECSHFDSMQWPRWQKMERPPPHASQLHVALWQARRWGSFPRSTMALHNITTAA